MNPYVIAVISVTIASFSQVFLKKSASGTHRSLRDEYINPLVITGYGMLFASMMLTIYAYKRLPFMNIPVIESFGYVLVMFFGLMFFREKITLRKAAGVLLILAGIFVYYH